MQQCRLMDYQQKHREINCCHSQKDLNAFVNCFAFLLVIFIIVAF
jgi:hypothetical protein